MTHSTTPSNNPSQQPQNPFPVAVADEAAVLAARQRGPLATLGVYFRLSGPGFLQSALTLGGGSLASSLFLGVMGGYSMLWVQLAAIVLGAIMLAAIGHVTLSLEESPFQGMRRHVNPALAWGWLLGALFANMIWSLPQYALSYAAITENLFPNLIADTNATAPKVIVTVILCAAITAATFFYGSGRGVKIYETILKLLVAVIVVSFMGVVLRLGMAGAIDWGAIFVGFIPNPSHLNHPAGELGRILDEIADPAVRAWWSEQIVSIQRDRMIAAASAAVGINMSFLMPFALLARGWNRNFRGAARFDLGIGLVIPFVIATGCIVVAAASQFHAKPWQGAEILDNGTPVLVAGANAGVFAELESRLAERQTAVPGVEGSVAETRLASMLLPRTNRELAASLEGLFGSSFLAQKIFGIGVLAMGLSTVSLLMLVSGFALCEALGAPHGGRIHKLGTLFAAFGLLWPFLWTGGSRAYLAITVGAIGYTLLPLALLSFFFMLNSRHLLGAQMPRGASRWAWNLTLGSALLLTGSASVWTAWKTYLYGFPIGKVMLFGGLILVTIGHFIVRARRSRA